MKIKVIKYYLEIKDSGELCPSKVTNSSLKFEEVKIPCPEYNRFFYLAVGGDYYWLTKRYWTYNQWYDHVNRPQLRTWAAYLSGAPCGYFELEKKDNDVEIVYIGLLQQFLGKGLGAQLLTEAVKQSWKMKVPRVWLHTCSWDHPIALKNYLARGFKIYKQEEKIKDLPDNSPGPWDGAHR